MVSYSDLCLTSFIIENDESVSRQMSGSIGGGEKDRIRIINHITQNVAYILRSAYATDGR